MAQEIVVNDGKASSLWHQVNASGIYVHVIKCKLSTCEWLVVSTSKGTYLKIAAKPFNTAPVHTLGRESDVTLTA